MAVPTHASDCRTRLFPTTCPDCAQRVYFFACSCGSKVLFDRPGQPWPEHGERCIPYLVRKLRDIEGLSNATILRLIENHARENDLDIPADVRRDLKKLELRDGWRRVVLDVAPFGEDVEFEGRVISADLQVNVLKRFGLPDNAISRGLFAPLLHEPLAELVVQGPRDEVTGFITQLTFYASLRRFKKSGCRVGSTVGCVLESRTLADGRRLWLATDVRLL